MNKLLVITVLVSLLALNVESFRVPRQAEEEEQEEQGTISKISNTIKSYYDRVVDTAYGYVESVRDLKLDERAVDYYNHATTVAGTYAGILNDQLYHIFAQ